MAVSKNTGNQRQNKKKRNKVLVFLVWCLFIGLLAAIIYFSFQNGEVSKQIGEKLFRTINDKLTLNLSLDEMSLEDQTKFIWLFRQAGRVLIFFLLGIVGCVTVMITFPRMNILMQAVLSGGVLTAIAYATEKGKDYLADRHYSYYEMILSICAVLAGWVCMAVIGSLFRWLVRLTHR